MGGGGGKRGEKVRGKSVVEEVLSVRYILWSLSSPLLPLHPGHFTETWVQVFKDCHGDLLLWVVLCLYTVLVVLDSIVYFNCVAVFEALLISLNLMAILHFEPMISSKYVKRFSLGTVTYSEILVCNTFLVCEQVYYMHTIYVFVTVPCTCRNWRLFHCVFGLYHHIQNGRIIELPLKVGLMRPM